MRLGPLRLAEAGADLEPADVHADRRRVVVPGGGRGSRRCREDRGRGGNRYRGRGGSGDHGGCGRGPRGRGRRRPAPRRGRQRRGPSRAVCLRGHGRGPLRLPVAVLDMPDRRRPAPRRRPGGSRRSRVRGRGGLGSRARLGRRRVLRARGVGRRLRVTRRRLWRGDLLLDDLEPTSSGVRRDRLEGLRERGHAHRPRGDPAEEVGHACSPPASSRYAARRRSSSASTSASLQP